MCKSRNHFDFQHTSCIRGICYAYDDLWRSTRSLKSTKKKSFQLLNHVQPMETISTVPIEGNVNQSVEETKIDD